MVDYGQESPFILDIKNSGIYMFVVEGGDSGQNVGSMVRACTRLQRDSKLILLRGGYGAMENGGGGSYVGLLHEDHGFPSKKSKSFVSKHSSKDHALSSKDCSGLSVAATFETQTNISLLLCAGGGGLNNSDKRKYSHISTPITFLPPNVGGKICGDYGHLSIVDQFRAFEEEGSFPDAIDSISAFLKTFALDACSISSSFFPSHAPLSSSPVEYHDLSPSYVLCRLRSVAIMAGMELKEEKHSKEFSRQSDSYADFGHGLGIKDGVLFSPSNSSGKRNQKLSGICGGGMDGGGGYVGGFGGKRIDDMSVIGHDGSLEIEQVSSEFACGGGSLFVNPQICCHCPIQKTVKKLCSHLMSEQHLSKYDACQEQKTIDEYIEMGEISPSDAKDGYIGYLLGLELSPLMISKILTLEFQSLMHKAGTGNIVTRRIVETTAKNQRMISVKSGRDNVLQEYRKLAHILPEEEKLDPDLLASLAQESPEEEKKRLEDEEEITLTKITRKQYNENIKKVEKMIEESKRKKSAIARQIRTLERDKDKKELYQKKACSMGISLESLFLKYWDNRSELEKLVESSAEEDSRKKESQNDKEDKDKQKEGRKLADKIAAKLTKLIEEYSFAPGFIITDGEALMLNVGKRLQEYKSKEAPLVINHVWCLAHQLDLLLGDFMKLKENRFISELITKISLAQMHHKNKLTKYQIKSVTKCMTRWVENVECTLDILAKWLNYRLFCDTYIKDEEEKKYVVEKLFSEDNRKKLKKMSVFFITLERAVICVQGREVDFAIKDIHCLLFNIDEMRKEGYSIPPNYAKREANIRKALDLYQDVVEFLPDHSPRKNVKQLLAILKKYDYNNRMDGLCQMDLKFELTSYAQEDVLDLSRLNIDEKREKYYDYWKKHDASFKFVEPLLTISLSGAEVERFFSAYGLILTPQRSSLKNETAARYSTLKYHWNMINPEVPRCKQAGKMRSSQDALQSGPLKKRSEISLPVSVEKESQVEEHSIGAVGKSSHKLCHSPKNLQCIVEFFPVIPKSPISDLSEESSISD
ncbi:hypothetical protein ADUPG1_009828 [Aduncisulcus paluster]|uniref:HAT C-terminal dimerisation domain-containing protein n=1 Tax=Aduncisulcus paluster TaxID=2918883 RepID=A0ABQ5KZQ9_9EUKA|nr:hypothetical protein ADUPG1_009828 [Aduncisulcus paluster]